MFVRSLMLFLPALALAGGCASGPKNSALDAEVAAKPARRGPVAACGQTDQSTNFLGLEPGSLVRLQSHVEDDIAPNWSPDMEFYLGGVTSVTQLMGVDDAGCPGVYVENDGGVFFWRVRDLEILKESAQPTRCGQNEWTANFLGLDPGMKVEIQRPSAWYGEKNWVDAMDEFLGKTATVTAFSGVDDAGCPGVSLDVDEGTFFWRVRDLKPAPR